MSYCRWSEDSDVYIYQSIDCWVCCNCDLGSGFPTLAELKRHVEQHIARGDKVPDYVLERINAELESGGQTFRTFVDPVIPAKQLAPPERN